MQVSMPAAQIDASSTLDPLPSVLKHGLIAVSLLGLLSSISSSTLLIYLTYKLIRWRLRGQARKGYNQFVLLIYNLVLADVQQSIAFSLTARWLVDDKINVKTSTCWAEGWFVSTGDLASGVWIFAIALHTFFAITKGKKLPYPIFLTSIIGLWLFIYAMAIAGISINRQGFYVRAGARVSRSSHRHPQGSVLFTGFAAKLILNSAGSARDTLLRDSGYITSGSSSPCLVPSFSTPSLIPRYILAYARTP